MSNNLDSDGNLMLILDDNNELLIFLGLILALYKKMSLIMLLRCILEMYLREK